MSIFWLGGTPEKVPQEAIINDMYEDRYFLPGIIHGGEDYLIRAYLNDAHCENGDNGDHDQFEIDYITRDLIKEAQAVDPSLGKAFYEYLFRAENFCCSNDGTGDFASIVEAWPESVYMTHSELVRWADGNYKSPNKKTDTGVFNNPEKISVPLGDGFSIVAERNIDSDYKEVFVYLKCDSDGCIVQDLAIVGENYTYDEEGKVKPLHGDYSVKVYADPDNEDWTYEHRFGRHVEEDA